MKKHNGDGIKWIAKNPNALRNFFIEDRFEAGLVLSGTEIKSLRTQAPHLSDSYAEFRTLGSSGIEAWLMNVHIGPYSHGNIWNHDSLRPRKLLLHSREIKMLHGLVMQKGKTVVPVAIYFKKGMAKVELGYGTGKKAHDKRQDLKERDADREMERALRYRNKGWTRD